MKVQNMNDWTFMKEAITSKNYANGFYVAGLEIGFAMRIIWRLIWRLI